MTAPKKKAEKKADTPKTAESKEDKVASPATIVASTKISKSDEVLFVSANRDYSVPILAGGKTYLPQREGDVIVWKVDRANAAAFERHTLVKFGKIARALEK